MMRIWVGAIAAVLLSAGMAQAATPAEAVAFCQDQGGFGQTFGEGPPGGARPIGKSMFAKLDAAYAPFTQAELVYSPNSHKLHTIAATARYGSAEEALKVLEALKAAAKADGRFTYGPDADAGEDDIAYYSTGRTVGGERQGLQLELFTSGSEVILDCVSLKVQQVALDEIWGRSPPTQKPTPPTLTLPAPPADGVCDAPASRTAFLADFEKRMDDSMAFGTEASQYSTQIAQWKAAQLKAKKVWSDEEDAQFSMAALNDPVFGKLFEASMGDFGAFMEDLGAYSDAMDRKDEAAACSAAVKALATTRRFLAGMQEQWAFINARYDALAKSKGVVLD